MQKDCLRQELSYAGRGEEQSHLKGGKENGGRKWKWRVLHAGGWGRGELGGRRRRGAADIGEFQPGRSREGNAEAGWRGEWAAGDGRAGSCPYPSPGAPSPHTRSDEGEYGGDIHMGRVMSLPTTSRPHQTAPPCLARPPSQSVHKGRMIRLQRFSSKSPTMCFAPQKPIQLLENKYGSSALKPL